VSVKLDFVATNAKCLTYALCRQRDAHQAPTVTRVRMTLLNVSLLLYLLVWFLIKYTWSIIIIVVVICIFVSGHAIATFNTTSAATFQGQGYTGKTLTVMDITLRTRTLDGTVLVVVSPNSFKVAAIGFRNGSVVVHLGAITVTTNASVSNGLWHQIKVMLNGTRDVPGSVTVFVNSTSTSTYPAAEQALNESLKLDLSASIIYMGSSVPDNISLPAGQFKGCIEVVRINDHLLPFVSYNQNGSTSNNSFSFAALSQLDLLTGSCRGDAVCETEGACANGATCIDVWNDYTCTCAPGYTGTRCQVNIDDCADTPCQHGGVCTDGVSSFNCTCQPGYTGSRCETDIDECASQPCVTSATCVDGINSYQCQCPTGFTGNTCELEVSWYNLHSVSVIIRY
jgi:protein crumbs